MTKFFKIRAKATGRFYTGGLRYDPTFSNDGMQYTAQAGITSALRFIAERGPEVVIRNIKIMTSHKKSNNGGVAPSDLAWYEGRRQENIELQSELEIVEFTEVEVGIVKKAK